ncbi:Phage-related lysozyme (muramidase), GH24 family [Pseudooceanicola antarcticus]|uniref:Lysozyme n=3 Tax=Pseudooceanicola antarcticus TaxID=1247613 RepID=A0A285J525_9RHOB|nr:lysozyme [Pseudooceanicola antarcticus]SNY55308.1 Phage-related lysozyme (muramidase), GH24 family [Pseudooceanicola antarcticus]
MKLRLLSNWQSILRYAWSIWLMLACAVLILCSVALMFLDARMLGIPAPVFALLAGLLAVLAIPARVIFQEKVEAFLVEEDGAMRIGLPRSWFGRGATGAAAVIALAVSFIEPWEGTRLKAYLDIAGIPTICTGHTEGVELGDTATAAECREMFMAEVVAFEARIRPCLPELLPEQSRAAFVSAAYNIGAGAFCGSSMSRRALAGDLAGACDALLMWNKARMKGRLQPVRGLTRRREAERDLCLQGLAA